MTKFRRLNSTLNYSIVKMRMYSKMYQNMPYSLCGKNRDSICDEKENFFFLNRLLSLTGIT